MVKQKFIGRISIGILIAAMIMTQTPVAFAGEMQTASGEQEAESNDVMEQPQEPSSEQPMEFQELEDVRQPVKPQKPTGSEAQTEVQEPEESQSQYVPSVPQLPSMPDSVEDGIDSDGFHVMNAMGSGNATGQQLVKVHFNESIEFNLEIETATFNNKTYQVTDWKKSFFTVDVGEDTNTLDNLEMIVVVKGGDEYTLSLEENGQGNENGNGQTQYWVTKVTANSGEGGEEDVDKENWAPIVINYKTCNTSMDGDVDEGNRIDSVAGLFVNMGDTSAEEYVKLLASASNDQAIKLYNNEKDDATVTPLGSFIPVSKTIDGVNYRIVTAHRVVTRDEDGIIYIDIHYAPEDIEFPGDGKYVRIPVTVNYFGCVEDAEADKVLSGAALLSESVNLYSVIGKDTLEQGDIDSVIEQLLTIDKMLLTASETATNNDKMLKDYSIEIAGYELAEHRYIVGDDNSITINFHYVKKDDGNTEGPGDGGNTGGGDNNNDNPGTGGGNTGGGGRDRDTTGGGNVNVPDNEVPAGEAPEMSIEDDILPAGAAPEMTVEDDQVPAGQLPKTGGIDSGYLFGLGGLMTLIGAALRKKTANR